MHKSYHCRFSRDGLQAPVGSILALNMFGTGTLLWLQPKESLRRWWEPRRAFSIRRRRQDVGLGHITTE